MKKCFNFELYTQLKKQQEMKRQEELTKQEELKKQQEMKRQEELKRLEELKKKELNYKSWKKSTYFGILGCNRYEGFC